MKPGFLVRAGLGALIVSLAALATTGGCAGGSDTNLSGGGGQGGQTLGSGGKDHGNGGSGGIGGASSSSSSSSSSASASSTSSATGSGGNGGGGGQMACTPVTGSSDYPAEVEQNDTQATANALVSGAKGFTGSLCPIGDADVYSLDVVGGAALTLKVSQDGTGCPLMHGIQMLLLDSNFVTIASNVNGNGGCPGLTPVNTPSLASMAGGTYFVKIRNLTAQLVPQYQLDALAQPPICGDGIASLANNEQCDDGNTADGDGCSSTCQLEQGHWLDETEPNDMVDAANNVDGYDGAVGAIGSIGDVDSFSFTVTQPGSSVIIRVSDGLGHCPQGSWSPELILRDPSGTQITSTTGGDADGCPLLAPSVDMATTNLAVGTYTVQVHDEFDGNTQGVYVVEIRVALPGCGDGVVQTGEQCDDGNLVSGDGCSSTCQFEADYIPETEINDTQALANPLGTHAGFIASIEPAGDIDFFTANVTVPGSSIFIEVGDGLGHCPNNWQPTVRLFGPSHTLIATGDSSSSTSCAAITPQNESGAGNLAVGAYTIGVSSQDGVTTQDNYVVKIRVAAPGCGDGVIQSGEQCDDGNTTSGDGCSSTCQAEAPYELEPNNTSAQATPPWSGFSTWKATIAPLGDHDYFSFTLTGTSTVTLETHAIDDATSCDLDTVLFLYDSTNTQLATNDDDGNNSPCSLVTKSGLPAGTYYARVNAYMDENTGPYQLDLTVQ